MLLDTAIDNRFVSLQRIFLSSLFQSQQDTSSTSSLHQVLTFLGNIYMGNSQKRSGNMNGLMGGENGAQICVQTKSGFVKENSVTCHLCT